mmetsp:Transcript_19550/g.61399  ORF Transcript_19550/g.61399 Transcript_19550/m.61399 type:complete len:334 (-) Transcript_19550:35-1036(-)
MKGKDPTLLRERRVLREHHHVDLRVHGVHEMQRQLGHSQALPDAGLRCLLPEDLGQAHAARLAEGLLRRIEQGRLLPLPPAVGCHADVQLVGHAPAPLLLVLIHPCLDLLLAVWHGHTRQAEVVLQSQQRRALLHGVSEVVGAQRHVQVGALVLRQLQRGGVDALPGGPQERARIAEVARDGQKFLRLSPLRGIRWPEVLEHSHHLRCRAENEHAHSGRIGILALQLRRRGYDLELCGLERDDLPALVPNDLPRLLVGQPVAVQRLEGIVDDAAPAVPVQDNGPGFQLLWQRHALPHFGLLGLLPRALRRRPHLRGPSATPGRAGAQALSHPP